MLLYRTHPFLPHQLIYPQEFCGGSSVGGDMKGDLGTAGPDWLTDWLTQYDLTPHCGNK